MKKCTKCKENKEEKEFHKDKTKLDGYCCSCKKCVSILRKEKLKANKKEIPINKRKCKTCGIIKDLVGFYVQKSKKHGRGYCCKQCHKERRKERYKNKKYEFVWRRLLASSLKRLGQKKKYKTEYLLNYSPKKLRLHIENLWTPGMNWDNYGEWHIDHIIPVHLFPKNTKPSIVNCLKNLRPMWASTREIDGVIYEGNLNRSKDKHNKLETDGRPLTLLLDIDGTLIEHFKSPNEVYQLNPVLLEGVINKFKEWDAKSYQIILITGRKESMREVTEKQLQSLGLFWDQLIMGVGGGRRVIFNDLKPNSKLATAIAINLERDSGLHNVDIDSALIIQSLSYLYETDLIIRQ